MPELKLIVRSDHLARLPARAVLLGMTFAAISVYSSAVLSQQFPQRPVRFIVPIAPGGGGDITTRAVAQKLTEAWGQTVVVDNRPGGTGSIGLGIAANSRPDGYTISLCTGSHAALQAMQPGKLTYDLLQGFSHVTQVTAQSYVLVVNPSVAAKTIPDLVALSNTRQSGLTYGSSGIGGLQHLSGALLASLAKAKLLHVP